MTQANIAVSHQMCTRHAENSLCVYFMNPFHPALTITLPCNAVASAVCGLSSLLAIALESNPAVVYFYDFNSKQIKRRIRLRFPVLQIALTDNIVAIRTEFNFLVFSRVDYKMLHVAVSDSPLSVRNSTVAYSKGKTLFVLETQPMQMFYRDFDSQIQRQFISEDRSMCAVVDATGRTIWLLNCLTNQVQQFRRGAEASKIYSVDFQENFMLCSGETGTIHLFKMNENKQKSTLKASCRGEAWFSSVQGEIVCLGEAGVSKLRYQKNSVAQISEWKWE